MHGASPNARRCRVRLRYLMGVVSALSLVRIHANDKALTRNVEVMTNDAMSPLFLAAIEATEEAVYNSMFKAATMTGNGHTVEALPIEKTVEILKERRVIK